MGPGHLSPDRLLSQRREECRYYLILARDLGYGDTRTLEKNLEEVSRLLEAYTRRVARS